MAEVLCGVRLIVLVIFLSRTCAHYLAEPRSIIRGVRSNGKHSLTRRNIDNSLKIKAYPDPSMQKLSSNFRKLIVDRLLPDALAYFGKALTVRQRISPLQLQRKCRRSEFFKKNNGTVIRYCRTECESATYCGTVLVPEAHLDVCRVCNSSETHCSDAFKSTGIVNVDFVLYVSAIATLHCRDQDDVLAYASTCQQEQALDRPVAGFVNFCGEKLARGFHYRHMLAVVKHEIFHAIGFSSSLYGFYRADNGMRLTARLPDGRPVSKWSDKVNRHYLYGIMEVVKI